MAYGMGNELAMLEEALEAAGIAWWVLELPSGAVFFSPNKARMLDHSADMFLHYKDFMKLVHPDDQERIMQDMRNHMEGKADVYETRYRIQRADGEYITFYDRGKIVHKKPNGDITIAGMVLDVTSFKLDVTDPKDT